MSEVYQQLLLDKESRKYVVINTHHGLFHTMGCSGATDSHLEYLRPQGFSKLVMESILSDITGIVVYSDDFLVTGRSEQESLRGHQTAQALALPQPYGVYYTPGVPSP